ncbi:MAG TPA: plastocyanin/azurin family copper-binding protein [Planctomycetota bacterium]|nr:plastocyanin/azurin family copper-binding protein [Planctomycetota bacterium]
MKVLFSTLVAASLSAAVAAWTAPAPTLDYVVTFDKNFHPDTLEIKIGDTVIWKNFDSESHQIIAELSPFLPQEEDRFESGEIPTGGQYQHTFTRAGVCKYYSRFHPEMSGKVLISR